MEEAAVRIQVLEAKMLAAASGLVEQVQRCRARSTACRGAALAMRAVAALPLNRHHNGRAISLLSLPDNALELIATKMGKRARVLCSRLRLLYCSPGAVLRPQAPADVAQRDETLIPYMLSAVRSWHHPEALQRLVVDGMVLNGPSWHAIVETLPGLRELECWDLDPARNNPRGVPLAVHTALTSLNMESILPGALLTLATCVPHLQSLEIGGLEDLPHPAVLWRALASLRGLQHLDLAVECRHLAHPVAFPSAMEQLTGLTHLALLLDYSKVDEVLPAEDMQVFTRAVAGLQQLVSINLSNFSAVGASLGPALQALRRLTRLQLGDIHAFDRHPIQRLAIRFPELRAMPCLQHLRFSGPLVVGSGELLRACCGGSTSLRALELEDIGQDLLPAACAVVSCLPGLTMLRLQLLPRSMLAEPAQGLDQLLTSALSRHPHLRHLEVQAEEHGFVPWLTTLTALSCLKLRFESSGLGESELEVVGSLTSLRKLALGHFEAVGMCTLCMEAVRKLPQLEDLELAYNTWGGEGLELLVPPPQQLKKITLASFKQRMMPLPWELAVVEELYPFGVDVDNMSTY